MFKIAISGKANSGKNTVSKTLCRLLRKDKYLSCEYIAFADPIKAMIRLMYPDLPEKYLTGPSIYRKENIPGSFKDGSPLTVRQLLIDLGGYGRKCNENTWIIPFEKTFSSTKVQKKNIVIVTDVRYRNEFEFLKEKGFYQIRLLRDDYTKINDASETNQDSIKDSEFDYILDNNRSLKDLKLEVTKIANILKS